MEESLESAPLTSEHKKESPLRIQMPDELEPKEKHQPEASQVMNGHGGHDHGHGHDDGPKSTRVPPWLVDMIDVVFKIKRRNTTVEVCTCLVHVDQLFYLL